MQMLIAAREKSRWLVESLREKREELAANPPAMDPGKSAEGRAAMDYAVAAAERTLNSIEAALELALNSRLDDTAANN